MLGANWQQTVAEGELEGILGPKGILALRDEAPFDGSFDDARQHSTMLVTLDKQGDLGNSRIGLQSCGFGRGGGKIQHNFAVFFNFQILQGWAHSSLKNKARVFGPIFACTQ